MDRASAHTYVLILAGGGGTRLWPMSRDNSPKQFLKLFEGKSLFRLTFERALKITTADKIFVTTSLKYVDEIKKEAPEISRDQIIGEPIRRDTAMGFAIGALYISKKDPDAVIVNLASDHLITPMGIFAKDAKLAASIAYNKNEFVTIGIKPKFPHTGMGHIKAVKKYSSNSDILVGTKFVEKPELSLAKKYTESGEYYWNACLYVWRADLILDLLKTHSPKTVALFPKLSASIGNSDEKEMIQHVFQMAPTISIDYAVSEKLKKFICIPGNFNWVDVGDWKEIWNNLPQDELGNVIAGSENSEYIGINSENNLLFLNKKLIATVGLHNMIIIDTPDALLICPKDSAQSVKKTVEMLKEKKLTEYL